MNTSTYYNLKLVEGTDIVNPLTTDVPNYETIDEQMHNNSIAGVTLATEVANGKVHALIRQNNECAVIRFIATSNWALGDTITVDGIPVVALLPNGESLPDRAYVINANVLCILTGTNLTVYSEGNKTKNANEILYKNTNVEAELDKLNGSIEQINSNLNVRYNEETDVVEIYFNGEWKDWERVGFKFDYIFKQGTGLMCDYTVGRECSVSSSTANEFVISFTKNGFGGNIIFQKNFVGKTGTLVIEYTLSSTSWTDGPKICNGSTPNEYTNSIQLDKMLKNTARVPLSSLGINTSYPYLQITANPTSAGQTIKITNMYIEN